MALAAIEVIFDEEDFWKCRKHPSQPRYGICPSCLFDRLSILCPDCAKVRPCTCFPSSSSSSSSSSFSSSSISSAFDPARSSVSGGVGAIGRVSNLIESEPAFQRSRSVAVEFGGGMRSDPEGGKVEEVKRWRNFWGFLKSAKEKRSDVDMFSRSKSVGVGRSGDARLKGRKWQFPSPVMAFLQKKRSTGIKAEMLS